MADIEKIMDRIDKVNADIDKRYERNKTLEAREQKLLGKLQATGVPINDYADEKLQRAKWRKKPNSMGHYFYDEYEHPTIVDREYLESNQEARSIDFDIRINLGEQASNWNKLFELEDKLMDLQMKLQQEQLKQKELDDIPPILQELRQNIYDLFLNRYTGYKETSLEIASKIGGMYGSYRKEMMKELFVVYGAIVADYEYWADASDEEIEKRARRSADAYVMDLIRRVTKKVGTITDYSDLTVRGPAINGRIIGDRGSTYVDTITAGGYNIQRLHYRVILR